MANKDDGTLEAAPQASISMQFAGESLCVMVDAVFGGAVCEGGNVCIITIREDPQARIF